MNVDTLTNKQLEVLAELKSFNYRLERIADRIGTSTGELSPIHPAPNSGADKGPSGIFTTDTMTFYEDINSMMSYIRGNINRLEKFTLTAPSEPTTATQVGRGY